MPSIILALMFAQVATQSELQQKPSLQCDRGPLRKSYGGSPWVVYGCSDSMTLVVVADAGNPASPFYFVIYPKDGKYDMYGEGTGSKSASDAAFEDLKKLSPSNIVALLHETKATAKP